MNDYKHIPSDELPKGDEGEMLAIVTSIQIAHSFSKSAILDSYFFELSRLVKGNTEVGKSVAKMLGFNLFKKYKKFVADEEKAATLGEALKAQAAHIKSPNDGVLFAEFMKHCESPVVKQQTQSVPDYFERAERTHKEVEDRKRLGWRHPGSLIGLIFWKLNMGLTQRIVQEVDGFFWPVLRRLIPKSSN